MLGKRALRGNSAGCLVRSEDRAGLDRWRSAMLLRRLIFLKEEATDLLGRRPIMLLAIGQLENIHTASPLEAETPSTSLDHQLRVRRSSKLLWSSMIEQASCSLLLLLDSTNGTGISRLLAWACTKDHHPVHAEQAKRLNLQRLIQSTEVAVRGCRSLIRQIVTSLLRAVA